MADDRLMLSALKTSKTYSLINNVSQRRCLIHVKLTDLCMKTVENLVDSDKGAFFSLWFDDNGGTMSIPVDHDSRKFHFKTAPLQDGEGQSSLECVHQGLLAPQDHALSCWGTMEHKATVQATDEVYLQTKKNWESVEKLRKEKTAQEIKVPQGRSSSKAKPFQSIDRISPVPAALRKPNRPKPPPPSTSKPPSTAKISRLPLTKSHSTQPRVATTTTSSVDSKPKSTGRSTHSLKDRIIYMLALKPLPREQIVTKLKKATKRSETAMSNLDAILHEVSESSQGMYRLKSLYLKNLDVEQWPFYNEAQKQMLKRSKETGMPEGVSEGLSAASKRPNNEHHEVALKKVKLSQPVSELSSVNTSSLHSSTSDTRLAEVAAEQHASNISTNISEPLKHKDHVQTCSTDRHSSKSKKKKKKRKEDVEVVTTDPTSTTSTPDHMSQFPTLTSEEERCRYKQIFNMEYGEYLSLKNSIDQVAQLNQRECAALSERLDSVPENSDEYLEVKRLIQEKYLEVQQNKSYLENKNKFNELHQKLNHIKQMVLQYDAKHRTAV